jgi:hypothetical protein
VGPDLGGPQDAIAETVVGVAVGVDDDPDGEGSDRLEVPDDLGGLSVADSRVYEQDAGVTEYDADILVIEGVSPDEYAIADLGPI